MKNTILSYKSIILIILSIILSTIITSLCFMFFVIPNYFDDTFLYNKKIKEIEALVDEYYVGNFDKNVITDSIAAGYVAGLNDKYGYYYPLKEAEERLQDMSGYSSGFGVQVSEHPDNKTLYVIAVHENSPAQNAGIIKGDEIIKIEDKVVSEIGVSSALSYMKSLKSDQVVNVTVLRNGENKNLQVVLSNYETQSIFFENINNVGYIEITSFNDNSIKQFKNAVNILIAEGVSALIFDVRGNGGGTVISVHEILDFLLPEGLVLEVKYKNSENDVRYMSDSSEIDIPMAVLTDENSASASEIFAQALKDYDKAIIVGNNTYGKGVVQKNFLLSDGSLVKFTVGKYFTKNGTCLDGIGVSPDYEVKLSTEELKYRFINGIINDRVFNTAVSKLFYPS